MYTGARGDVRRKPDRLAHVGERRNREEVLREERGDHLEAHAEREDGRSQVAHPLQLEGRSQTGIR